MDLYLFFKRLFANPVMSEEVMRAQTVFLFLQLVRRPRFQRSAPLLCTSGHLDPDIGPC